MIRNIKLRGHRGIGEITLLDLGKINLISGKNNSGKTSILEAFQLKDNNVIGYSNYLNDLLKIFSSASGELKSSILKTLKYFAEENPVLYLDEIDQLLSDERIKNWPDTSHIGTIRSQINGYLNGKDQNQPKIIYIPPKRNLELRKGIPDEVPNPNGLGVLSNIFRYSSQPPKTDERIKYEFIESSFKDISDGWEFRISLIKREQNVQLWFSDDGEKWRPAADCGLGLQDLLIMLFFAIATDYAVYLIEEPETHLHPEIQRKLMLFFSTLKEKQFILTTHSNVFLSSIVVDKIYLAEYSTEITLRDVTSTALVLEALGYSVADNLLSDLIILVEGPYDKIVLQQFLHKMGILGKYNIRFFALGGDIMNTQDLSVFTESKNVVALIDSDRKSEKVRKEFLKQCKKLGIGVHKLDRYAIENYYSLDVLREIYGSQIPVEIKEIKHNEKLETQIGMNVKKKSKEIASKMSISDIKGTDLHDIFLKNTVEKKLKRLHRKKS